PDEAVAPAGPTPEENRAAAQALAAAASVACQVTEAQHLGVIGEQIPVYEAACAAGPGYLLIASTPPQANDCVVLAGSAATLRARDPAADVGTQCSLPANTDIARVIAGYARDAGIDCTVDEGGA